MHLHLDPLGGMAGDMFIAAVLDARPDLEASLQQAIDACGLPTGWQVVHARRRTKSIDARTFDVVAPDGPTRASGRYAALMERIDQMALAEPVKGRARHIYTLLGECEAIVHGIELADVHFHELADWDSLVDIIGAAALLELLGVTTVTAARIPRGSGMVRTEHGPLPVPAPATAKLLQGMTLVEDGIPGERVTPTGAAILKSLDVTGEPLPAGSYRQLDSGFGAGMRELEGCANVLRVQMLGPLSAERGSVPGEAGRIAVVEFEVDDQTPEDLAAGLDVMRSTSGVMDVLTYAAMGKKGRVVQAVRVLAEPGVIGAVMASCFNQFATLGLRHSVVDRQMLERKMVAVATHAGDVPVKVATRPDGSHSAKAEHDVVAAHTSSQAERRSLAGEAEQMALREARTDTNTSADTSDE